MQSSLEMKGMDARKTTLVQNNFDKSYEYSSLHTDALSNGDPHGKGTLSGAHTHTTPDANKQPVIDYSNLDTSKGGGLYDIEGRNGVGGRNFLMTISKYNADHEYGPNSVDTSANLADGQIKF